MADTMISLFNVTWKTYFYNSQFQKLVRSKSSGRTFAKNTHKEHAIRNEPQDAHIVKKTTDEVSNHLKVDEAIYLPQEVVFICCIKPTYMI